MIKFPILYTFFLLIFFPGYSYSKCLVVVFGDIEEEVHRRSIDAQKKIVSEAGCEVIESGWEESKLKISALNEKDNLVLMQVGHMTGFAPETDFCNIFTGRNTKDPKGLGNYDSLTFCSNKNVRRAFTGTNSAALTFVTTDLDYDEVFKAIPANVNVQFQSSTCHPAIHAYITSRVVEDPEFAKKVCAFSSVDEGDLHMRFGKNDTDNILANVWLQSINANKNFKSSNFEIPSIQTLEKNGNDFLKKHWNMYILPHDARSMGDGSVSSSKHFIRYIVKHSKEFCGKKQSFIPMNYSGMIEKRGIFRSLSIGDLSKLCINSKNSTLLETKKSLGMVVNDLSSIAKYLDDLSFFDTEGISWIEKQKLVTQLQETQKKLNLILNKISSKDILQIENDFNEWSKPIVSQVSSKYYEEINAENIKDLNKIRDWIVLNKSAPTNLSFMSYGSGNEKNETISFYQGIQASIEINCPGQISRSNSNQSDSREGYYKKEFEKCFHLKNRKIEDVSSEFSHKIVNEVMKDEILEDTKIQNYYRYLFANYKKYKSLQAINSLIPTLAEAEEYANLAVFSEIMTSENCPTKYRSNILKAYKNLKNCEARGF